MGTTLHLTFVILLRYGIDSPVQCIESVSIKLARVLAIVHLVIIGNTRKVWLICHAILHHIRFLMYDDSSKFTKCFPLNTKSF